MATPRRPTEEMLKGLDALVFDVQDAGVRFYTYTATMGYCMEEAAKRNIAFFVLDRPNPLGGEIIEGRCSIRGQDQFRRVLPVAGALRADDRELAQLFNAKNHIARTCTSFP